MIAKPRITRLPGSPTHGPDAGFTVHMNQAFEVEGVQFAPCDNWRSGVTVTQNGSKAIVAMISSGPVGLAAGVTPEGARIAAGCLIHLAKLLEDEAAEAAAFAIDKARRAGGTS